MEYDIIFYHSGRTAEAERLLEKQFGERKMTRRASAAAMTPEELAHRLQKSLKHSDMAVIIGGLDGGSQSTDSILSSILSARAGSLHSEKLTDEEEHTAYVIHAGFQSILVFPDDTEVIEAMLDKRLLEDLSRRYSLQREEPDRPVLDHVTGQLQQELSRMGEKDTSYVLACQRKQQEDRKLRWMIGILSCAGAALIVLSVVLFFL